MTSLIAVVLASLAVAGGQPAPDAVAQPVAAASRAGAHRNRDWPVFGAGPGRSNASTVATAINGRRAARLRRRTIALPGTVDSAPIYLHGVRVRGRRRSVVVMTTSYGRTLALDARSGQRLWEFVPPGISGWEGSAQITTAAPAADPRRRAVFAASPDGKVHKLALRDGHEVSGGDWPATITRLPAREKITSALNVFGHHVIATTGGYVGDAPPYQGHVVTIDRSTGRLRAVFNSLCSDVRHLLDPSTCPASDSAIWGRAGAVVDARRRELYVSTGNAPFDGVRNWGDSMLVLSFPGLKLKRNWTPYNQQQLTDEDKDLGSVAPVLLPGGLVLQGGKDKRMDLVSRRLPNGYERRPSARLGGQLQTLPLPGDAQVLATGAPAVSGRKVFVATASATAAYRLRHRRLRQIWSHPRPGTTPVVAGGLLYVYDPAGQLNVYRPGSGREVVSLPAAPGHWNSPIAVGGRVWLPEGDANAHQASGSASLYSVGPRG